MSKSFYFIRHGETEYNVKGIASGQKDIPLNETGIEQARLVKKVIAKLGIKPSIVVHSGLQRAMNTAKIANEDLALKMQVNVALQEEDYGDWEGQSFKQVIEPAIAKNGNTPPNGELKAFFVERVTAAFESILKHVEQIPLVVAHGGVYRCIQRYHKVHFGNNAHAENAKLYVFDYQSDLSNSNFPYLVTAYDLDATGELMSHLVEVKPHSW